MVSAVEPCCARCALVAQPLLAVCVGTEEHSENSTLSLAIRRGVTGNRFPLNTSDTILAVPNTSTRRTYQARVSQNANSIETGRVWRVDTRNRLVTSTKLINIVTLATSSARMIAYCDVGKSWGVFEMARRKKFCRLHQGQTSQKLPAQGHFDGRPVR